MVVLKMAKKLLLVVEKALHDKITAIPAYVDQLVKDGFTVTVYQCDSRVTDASGKPYAVNVSSKAARLLAETVIWPAVNAGTDHVFILGEIPCAVSGLNLQPDGHASGYNFDGWRNTSNSSGAYRAPLYYGTPGQTWTDYGMAQLSMKLERNNQSNDGRFDQDAISVKPKACVGILGNWGDVAIDGNGVIRRAKIINDYLLRNISYRQGNWPRSGAAYELAATSTDPHGSKIWLDRTVATFGSANVTTNARVVLKGDLLTNRPVAFDMFYVGSDWTNSFVSKLQRPIAPVLFYRNSYNFEIYGGTAMMNTVKQSPLYGPLVTIPWYGAGLNLQPGMTVGEAFLATPQGSIPACMGFLGDVSLSI